MTERFFQSKIPLLFFLLLAVILRLYRFNNPIADWHAWRQADTSSVSRHFVTGGFDILHPHFDDLSNVPSGLDNPQGYRFVEFPLYNIAQAGLFVAFGHFTIEEWGRVVSIIATLFAMVFLYFLVKKYAGSTSAFFSVFFYAILPYAIYYGRTILPDSSMVAASLGSIYFFDRCLSHHSKYHIITGNFIASILFTAAAVLLKPYALFFTLPLFVLSYNQFGISFLKKWQLYLFAVMALVPLIFWRIWITQYPQGIPVSDWLFNGGGIRFKGAFFYWLFADRLSRLMLGYWGLPIFLLGILTAVRQSSTKKSNLFFFSFLASSLLYLTVIARGNVQHDYYQILILPTIVLFLGLGSSFLLNAPKEYFSKTVNILVLCISIAFAASFGWYFIRDYFNINNPAIVLAGEAVDKLTPKDARVVAPYEGDTSFLYQTKRQGWASFEKSLPELIQMGATYLVFVNPKPGDYKLSQYKTVVSTQQYVLYDLVQKP